VLSQTKFNAENIDHKLTLQEFKFRFGFGFATPGGLPKEIGHVKLSHKKQRRFVDENGVLQRTRDT